MKKQPVSAFTIVFGLITTTLIDTTGYTAPPVTEPDAKAISLVRAALTLSNPANPKTARIHAKGNLFIEQSKSQPPTIDAATWEARSDRVSNHLGLRHSRNCLD
jgi:hypothetical protein